MAKTTIRLPQNYRLDISFIKGRGIPDAEKLVPPLSKIQKIRSGSKTSRFFRYIMQHSKIKRILGTNLALLVIASSFISIPQFTDAKVESAEIILAPTNLSFRTEKSIQNPTKNTLIINQGYSHYHPGIDIEGATNDPVYPIMQGSVSFTQYSNYAYGNSVVVEHGSNLNSLYAHLSQIRVKKGNKVDHNTIIGTIGSTGYSTGSHLHLEVRDGAIPMNPLIILNQQ